MTLKDYLKVTMFKDLAPLIKIFDHYFTDADMTLKVVKAAKNYVIVSTGVHRYRSIKFLENGTLQINNWEVEVG